MTDPRSRRNWFHDRSLLLTMAPAFGVQFGLFAGTAKATNGDRAKYLGTGTDGYLATPIDVEERLSMVSSGMRPR